MASYDNTNLERAGSSPMATACLLISTFALCAAIFLALYEVGELRGKEGGIGRDAGGPAAVGKRFQDGLSSKVEDAIQSVKDEHGEAETSDDGDSGDSGDDDLEGLDGGDDEDDLEGLDGDDDDDDLEGL